MNKALPKLQCFYLVFLEVDAFACGFILSSQYLSFYSDENRFKKKDYRSTAVRCQRQIGGAGVVYVHELTEKSN